MNVKVTEIEMVRIDKRVILAIHMLSLRDALDRIEAALDGEEVTGRASEMLRDIRKDVIRRQRVLTQSCEYYESAEFIGRARELIGRP